MIKIPPQNKWTQPNNSDIFGSIYASRCLDLTANVGKLNVGSRLILNTSNDTVTEITDVPSAFRYFNNGSDSSYYTIAGTGGTGYVFKGGSTLGSNFSKVTTAGSPSAVDSLYSDMELAFGKLYISNGATNTVYSLNSSNTWASSITAGSTAYFNAMTYYAGRMYITKLGNLIQSWDSTEAVTSPTSFPNTNSNAIRLGDGEVITFLRSSSNRIWIGTINQSGGKGYIYSWDGSQPSINSAYRLESAGALACVIKDDIPYVMDANGSLLAWNGGTFKAIASLNRINDKALYNPYYANNERFIHPNGMTLNHRGKINFLIDATNYDVSNHNGTQEVTLPSGVWEYDPDIGLYHKHSVGLSTLAGDIVDYGQTRIFQAGALSEIITSQASPITTNGTFLAGVSYYTDATTVRNGIFYDNSLDTLQKSGYIITPKIFSPNIEDEWQSLYVRHKKLLNASDKFVIKHRNVDDEPTEATITWISRALFTTTADISDYVAGDEVEIVQGKAGGKCMHITTIQFDGTTYTVNVDESMTGAWGTAKARFQKWTKGCEQTSQLERYIKCNVGQKSTWVQFKIWFLFTGNNEIDDLILTNKVQTPAI